MSFIFGTVALVFHSQRKDPRLMVAAKREFSGALVPLELKPVITESFINDNYAHVPVINSKRR